MEYLIHLAILCGIYLILAQSFNLPFGVGRQFNLAHIAACAIGAYTTALLSTDGGLSFPLCLLSSIVVSGLFALLIGAIAARLEDDYFAIGTVAFSAVVSALLVNWKSVTHGVLGISGIPRPVIAGIEFESNARFLLLVLVLVTIVQVGMWLLFRSSWARGLRALAEYEEAALALGRNTGQIRNISFVLASALAGVAGSLLAVYINYIDPSSFTLTEMIFVLTIVVVGRPGSFGGVTAATIFLVLLPEPLRFLEIGPAVLGPMRQLLYASILFGVVFLNRSRLFPLERRI